MKIEKFVDILLKRGHKVIETKSCYWLNIDNCFYISLPYNHSVNPSKSEVKSIFSNDPLAVGVRYPTTQTIGKKSYFINCRNKDFNLMSLGKKARNQTRRGLENFQIKRINSDELIKSGYDLNIQTLLRQNRHMKLNRNKWKKYCNNSVIDSAHEIWGAYLENELAAFIVAVQIDDTCSILLHRSSTRHLRLYPNNAIVYSVVKKFLEREDVTVVSFGLQSVEDVDSLDKFKINMGFYQETVYQRFAVNPLLLPIIKIIPSRMLGFWGNHLQFGSRLRKIIKIVEFVKESV